LTIFSRNRKQVDNRECERSPPESTASGFHRIHIIAACETASFNADYARSVHIARAEGSTTKYEVIVVVGNPPVQLHTGSPGLCVYTRLVAVAVSVDVEAALVTVGVTVVVRAGSCRHLDQHTNVNKLSQVSYSGVNTASNVALGVRVSIQRFTSASMHVHSGKCHAGRTRAPISHQ